MLFLGNAIQTVKVNESVKLFTIRGTCFEAAEEGGNVTEEGCLSILHLNNGNL